MLEGIIHTLKDDYFDIQNRRKIIIPNKRKSYQINYNRDNKANLFLLLFFILFFLPIYAGKEKKFKKLIFTYDIKVTINQSGKQKILSDTFEKLPDVILINGANVEIKKEYDLESVNNTVIMKWNSDLGKCNEMFKDLSNIDSIEFSNFNQTNIVEMTSMFQG